MRHRTFPARITGQMPTTSNIGIPHGFTPIQEKLHIMRGEAFAQRRMFVQQAIEEGDSLRSTLAVAKARGSRIIEVPLKVETDEFGL